MKLPLSLILAATTISSVSAANFQRDDTASSVSAAASEKCNKDYRAILSNAPSPTPGPQFSAWLVTASGVRPSPTMQTEDMVDVAAMCTTSSDVNRAIEEAVSREPEDGQVRSQYEAWTASRDAWRSVLKPQFYRLGGWCGDVNAEVAGAMLYAVAI
ncbi:hypothetical protein QBC41DRAFT_374020 [Cercophora samala]|uniref:Uncharacterized protein n=1 Tax=Cercophora samala TaxID=330535 RepID=A0AA39ZCF2_9PEZI|nr:hypothetical protein QBC41DRAFT_374020 [Cercophora samala]